jgi:hypothetical protein
MTLANYISNLLYRYECVIVPNFGGFVTQEISAKVNHFTHTFDAPSKQLSFNPHLQKNDGLLANYIATAENISYTKALESIQNEVDSWKHQVRNQELELDLIGSFISNKEGKLIFEPSHTLNYLTQSFGLSSYVSPAIKRLSYKEKIKQLDSVTPVLEKTHKRRKTPLFIKYAASIAILFAVGTVAWNEYQKNTYNNLVAEAEQQQQKLDQSIQEATFVISNPLPTITLNITKETFNYHIIAGAFREPGNAENKLQQLREKGYDARILGVNKWNLTQVSFESFNSRQEALKQLHAIKQSESKDAWLLVKEY